MNKTDVKARQAAALSTPTDLKSNATRDISAALTTLLADIFALYIKTKNFHWHMSGPRFSRLSSLARRAKRSNFCDNGRHRRAGPQDWAARPFIRFGEISRLQRILDNDADYVTPPDMLAELREDNEQLTASLREVHALCDEHGDVASTSLIEVWIDEAERRTWFLFETGRT